MQDYTHTPNTVVAGRYRILRPIGQGGYGSVYVASRHGGPPVALKILRQRLADDEVARARFTREATFLQQLRHPNVVAALDAGETEEGMPFIAFELLEGEPLSGLLKREGALAPERVWSIAHQVLIALAYAHAQSLVHRDIKPSNVFLRSDRPAGQEVQVLDFGIAKAALGNRPQTALTESGQMLGTALYMAPEQARGRSDVDARADLYAVGVVLVEMVTGERLMPGHSDIDVIMAHVSDEPWTLPDAVMRSPLAAVIARAIDKDPAARFQSAAAMQQALDAAARAAHSPVQAGAQPVGSALQVPTGAQTSPARGGGAQGAPATAPPSGSRAAPTAPATPQAAWSGTPGAPPAAVGPTGSAAQPAFGKGAARSGPGKGLVLLALGVGLAGLAAGSVGVWMALRAPREPVAERSDDDGSEDEPMAASPAPTDPGSPPPIEGIDPERAIERLRARGFEVEVSRNQAPSINMVQFSVEDPDNAARVGYVIVAGHHSEESADAYAREAKKSSAEMAASKWDVRRHGNTVVHTSWMPGVDELHETMGWDEAG